MTATPKKVENTTMTEIDHKQNIDPIAFQTKWRESLDKSLPVLQDVYDNFDPKRLEGISFDPFNVGETWMEFWNTILSDKDTLAAWQNEYMNNWMKLWQSSAKAFLGEPVHNFVEENKGDRRFKDPVWRENVAFSFLRQSYLLTGQWLSKLVDEQTNLKPRDKHKLQFAMRQYIDAIAPSNFFMTNPEVWRETIETNGENLIKGFENLVSDIQRGGGLPRISKTKYEAFKVGENIAITEGQVVFRNELLELIHYKPTQDKVHGTPLLIIPPWINKYYILDLRPENSFVKWAVDQGFDVFMISWINPNSDYKDVQFEDYMTDGVFKSVDEILKHAPYAKDVHTVGYCIGGTLLSCALSVNAQKEKKLPIASATFFTTLMDFENAGDLTLFLEEPQISTIEQLMSDKGYLDAEILQTAFSLIRANDLIWTYVVNNYMMGKEPFPFDLLYWNDDSTRLPATMHGYYLRNMYRDNKLIEKGALEMDGVKVDLSKNTVPSYFLSTREDHIAPWQATYAGTQHLGGEKTFVLSASGHVAGVINPPHKNKYGFWENENLALDTEKWVKKASFSQGSWWPHWAEWVRSKGRTAKDVQAPKLEKGLCPAPGTYVNQK